MKLEIRCEDKTIIEEFEEHLKKVENLEYNKITQNGFDGWEAFIYFLFIGGGGTLLIKAVKDIILEFIKKDNVKSLKIDNVQLKGYSADDAVKIIGKIAEKDAKKDSN